MKCSGFADSKRFRCQNLVSKERQDLGKITCRIHDNDETEGLLYSGDRGDDEALTRYWLPLKSSQSNQPAEGSSARHALKLMFGGKDRKLTDRGRRSPGIRMAPRIGMLKTGTLMRMGSIIWRSFMPAHLATRFGSCPAAINWARTTSSSWSKKAGLNGLRAPFRLSAMAATSS